jgi:hypothetical protein
MSLFGFLIAVLVLGMLVLALWMYLNSRNARSLSDFDSHNHVTCMKCGRTLAGRPGLPQEGCICWECWAALPMNQPFDEEHKSK